MYNFMTMNSGTAFGPKTLRYRQFYKHASERFSLTAICYTASISLR